ncbi:GTPase IMAP family member 7 isoform X2 [Dunckerocampus dactyliophorus]|uniref:GTPase IMAP family member 7 isoform X2 n=1 Tax=Dunckerocampus dactyliophorus TaxID=161453 RepID=UPI002406D812|nr:GTPase IMAP family member 7 isoform X2 [Dunckerocampus dactyliophorus]
MTASGAQTELRLVVLGRTGTGRRSTVCSILGLQDEHQGKDDGQTEECSKHRGEAAGRQVLVVSSPDWFSADCHPEERRRHISDMITLSCPGPHAFLLCVSVNQPADGETKALDVLEKLFGASAVSRNTILLFTNMEELEEDERLEDYLVTWRKDLQVLLQRCGGRYHTLETRSESEALEGMLEKVEEAVKESGEEHFSSLLYEEVEEQVRKKQIEIVRERRKDAQDDPSSLRDSEVTDEEMEEAREEAERSIGDLNVDLDNIFPSSSISPASPFASSLRSFWETLVAWLKWLPTLVRREALLGALVGLFVGGPFGGMVGATVGSVATEVGRRKTQKTK